MAQHTTLDFLRRAGKQVTDRTQEVKKIFSDLDTALRLEPKHRSSLLLRAKVHGMLGHTGEVILDCTRMLDQVSAIAVSFW